MLSAMGPVISISSFTGLHEVPVAAPQLCHCTAEAAEDNIPTKEDGSAPIKFSLQEQMEARIGPWTAVCRPLLWGLLSYRADFQRLPCLGDNIDSEALLPNLQPTYPLGVLL